MRSAVPKVLHPLCGRPLVGWPIAAARAAGAERVVVVDNPSRRLEDRLPEGVESVVQEQPLGTADAVKAARERFADSAHVLVLSGDVPLITGEAIAALGAAHAAAGALATMATMILPDPGSYGRVVRDHAGAVQGVVEARDASPLQLAIDEVNTGIYVFDGPALAAALDAVGNDNAQGEYYLPDVLPILAARGPIEATAIDPGLTLGVNDRVDLAVVRRHAQARILEAHLRAGVTIVDPAQTSIDVDVVLGSDTVIEPGCVLKGRTRVGSVATIGPHTTLIDVEAGNGVTIRHSYAEGATLADGATVGPFAFLRPGARLEAGAKAGTFVEIKNSVIGEGSKVPHLSYIGDADVGPGTNLGAATITANYDGRHKHRTTIGAGVKTSVDTTLVAPVTVGDGAFTGAGSVITEDVPSGALGIARARQRNVDGYADRKP